MALGIPNYPSPDRAVAALRAMCDYAAWRRRPAAHRHPLPGQPPARGPRHPDAHPQRPARRSAKSRPRKSCGPTISTFSTATWPGRADEAVEIAERIGYPVVLKISSPDIIHKSDFGGVRINLANAEQVRDAFDLMMLRIQRRAPNAYIRGGVRREDGPRAAAR